MILALAAGVLLAPWQASAEPGFATVAVNMRAGPGTSFPVLQVIPAGARLDIVGCLSDYDWCDVSWGNARGWVAGSYLEARLDRRRVPVLRGRPPVVGFDFNRYWDDHYRGRSFYSHRDQWHSRYQGRTQGRGPGPFGPAWDTPITGETPRYR